jgi:hypothetical protein
MKIQRTTLINDLAKFAQEGSGVVIGSPGVGKSYAFLELRQLLKTRMIPHLILPVERLGRGTDEEVKSVLRRDGDFIDLLKSAAADFDHKGILMFDGFDAARGESEQIGILRLIERAVMDLSRYWNVLVSVRTFDALKSDRLSRLFPSDLDNTKAILPKCRHFVIPPLTPDEVSLALSQTSYAETIRSVKSDDFEALLTIPFNLWLVEQIMSAGIPQDDLSHIISEVQLLDLFWRRRVTNGSQSANREFILLELITRMVKTHDLTVNRSDVYNPQLQTEWNGLFSDGVLYEASDLQTKVGFTHNILFDYAVTVLLLDARSSTFAAFINEDMARPLFLRPSLVFHFTKLWHFDRVHFWINFWEALRQETIYVRQIIRLVLPAVVLNEARLIGDLQPILNNIAEKDGSGSEAMLFLFQAIRSLKTSRSRLWAEFLRGASRNIRQRFGWDGGIVANDLAAANSTQIEVLSDCGEYGRALMAWAYQERQTGDRAWFDRLIAIVGIPLIAKTYSSNPNESRSLLQRVFAFMDEPNFSIDCIFWLTQQVGELIPQDPRFVGLIYEAIFGHREISEDKTSMGGGTVLNLISTRRQDFDGCHYSLLTSFDKFLLHSPLVAIESGMRALQSFAELRHIKPYSSGKDQLHDRSQKFAFRGREATMISDTSAIWDQASNYPDRELAIMDSSFNWLAGAAANEQISEVEKFLDLVAINAKLAFIWRRLFRVGAQHPKVFARRLFELTLSEGVLTTSDLRIELDRFVHNAAPYWTKEQCAEFETTVLSLTNAPPDKKSDWRKTVRNRLIFQMPIEFLSTPEGIELHNAQVAAREGLETEEEFTARITSRPYSEDIYLKEQGVDVDSEANKSLKTQFDALKILTEDVSPASLDVMVEQAQKLTQQLIEGTQADSLITQMAWEKVASFAAVAAGHEVAQESKRFKSLEYILLEASQRDAPVADDTNNREWKSAVWSPAPRNDAAQGIPRLIAKSATPSLIDAVERLSKDPVPSVRFLLVSELWRLRETAPAKMWELIEHCIIKEENHVVLMGLTMTLWNTRGRDKSPHLSMLQQLYDRTEAQKLEDEEFLNSLVFMIVDYAVHNENKWADGLLARWRSDPLAYAPFLSRSGHRLIAYIKPHLKTTLLIRARGLLIAQLDAVATGLVRMQTEKAIVDKTKQPLIWRALYGVIDESVSRIYFACDVSPSLRQRNEEPLNEETRNNFFREAVPILDKVLSFGMSGDTGMLLAPTAHYFMQLLHGMLDYDPARMLRMAADVVTSSKRFGFNIDSIAMTDTVKLVESILADYRPNIQNTQSLTDLMNLLDAFVEVGWPDALNLVWRLDEVYR